MSTESRVPDTELKPGTGTSGHIVRTGARRIGVFAREESCLVAAEQAGAGARGNQVQTGARTRKDKAQTARWRSRDPSVMELARHLLDRCHYSPALTGP